MERNTLNLMGKIESDEIESISPSQNSPSSGSAKTTTKLKGVARFTVKGEPLLVAGTKGPAGLSLSNMTMSEIWNLYDADKDGWLTEEQMAASLSSVGIKLNDAEMSELRRETEDELFRWSDGSESSSDSEQDEQNQLQEEDIGIGDTGETLYEDSRGRIVLLKSVPRGYIRLLSNGDDGRPAYKLWREADLCLDRHRPECFEAWVAATCEPGLSLENTTGEIRSRTGFLEEVRQCQDSHVLGRFSERRATFGAAWEQRRVDTSGSEAGFFRWLRSLLTLDYWLGLRTAAVLRLRSPDLWLLGGSGREDRAPRTQDRIRPAEQRVRGVFLHQLAGHPPEKRRTIAADVFCAIADACAHEVHSAALAALAHSEVPAGEDGSEAANVEDDRDPTDLVPAPVGGYDAVLKDDAVAVALRRLGADLNSAELAQLIHDTASTSIISQSGNVMEQSTTAAGDEVSPIGEVEPVRHGDVDCTDVTAGTTTSANGQAQTGTHEMAGEDEGAHAAGVGADSKAGTGGAGVDLDHFVRMVEHLLEDVQRAAAVDRLLVEIVECMDLPAMDRFGSADPYITVCVVPHDGSFLAAGGSGGSGGSGGRLARLSPGTRSDGVQASTGCMRQTLAPVWNETLDFRGFHPDSEIRLACWDHSTSGFDDCLVGQASIHLQQLLGAPSINKATRMLDTWIDLVDEDGKMILGNFGGYSRLHGRFSLISGDVLELHRNERIVGLHDMVKLRVVSAENLPKMDKTDDGSVDPYCIISFGQQNFRSKTLYQEFNPTFDQVFTLVLVEDVIEVLVSVYDWDDEGKDDCVGAVKIPLNQIRSGQVKGWFDLRSTEDSTFVVNSAGTRSRIQIEAEFTGMDTMLATQTPLQILFNALASGHEPTMLECAGELWSMLENDPDGTARASLSLVPGCWQTLADVFVVARLDVELVRARDLPRMDYFGLCDPYVVLDVDGVTETSEIVKLIFDDRDVSNARTNLSLVVNCYDWDAVGEHDWIGSFEVPIKEWESGSHDSEWHTLLGKEEKVKGIRAGDEDRMVRRPIVGHSNRESMIQAHLSLVKCGKASDTCLAETAWAVVFAVQNHSWNAQLFGETFGGACYALGNLAASYKPNQDTIANLGTLEVILGLLNKWDPTNPTRLDTAITPAFQRSGCLCIANIIQDNPNQILRLLSIGRKQRGVSDLQRRAGGIGVLLDLIEQARPDPALLLKEGGDSAWDDVALATEAAVQAVASACFVNPGGLFNDKLHRAVDSVVRAVGRPGISVLKSLSRLPISGTGPRATKEAIRFARLTYEGIEAVLM